MKYATYDEMLFALTQHASFKEFKKLMEENELFGKRGWKDYVLYLVNALSEVSNQPGDKTVTFRGSVLDSFLINKATDFRFTESNPEGFFDSQRKKDVLENDALRLFIYAHGMHTASSDRVLASLERSLQETEFHTRKTTVPNRFPFEVGSQKPEADLIVIGKDPIEAMELAIIEEEEKESSPEKAEILRKNLLIYQLFFAGL